MIGNGAINNNPTFNWIKTLERGSIFAYSSNGTAPEGALLCDGSTISRTTYNLLFNVIGTTYGEGDGSTTFNVPNLTDKFIQGSGTAGTVKSAGLPDIEGSIGFRGESASWYSGCVYGANKTSGGTWDSTSKYAGTAYIDATRSSSIYGSSSTVQPPALTMLYYIKY